MVIIVFRDISKSCHRFNFPQILFYMNNHIPSIRPSECDDFKGFFSLKSATFDKIISSTNDLEKATSDIMLLLSNNADSITIEQSEKAFAETITTLEMALSSIINYNKMQKSPQLRSIVANSSNNSAVFSLFYDYVQLAIKVYNQKIFFNPSFFSYIIFFTNLLSCYIEIFQNPSPTVRKKFQNSWSDYYSISTRITNFNEEIGIPLEFSKFDRSFDTSEIQKLKKIAENRIYDIIQSLNVVKKDIQELDKENTNALVKNMIIDLRTLRSHFYDMQEYSSSSDQGFIIEKLSAINSLLATLESCVSFYNLYEMTNKLNVLIRNDVFVLPNDIIQNDYNNWVCFRLSIQAIHLNLKLITLIRYSMQVPDEKVEICYRISKSIISSIENSLNDPKLTDLIKQFIDNMKQLQLVDDNAVFEKFITFYEEQLMNVEKRFEETKEPVDKFFLKVKSYFDNFKSSWKRFKENRNLVYATSCFSFFSNFEDCYRDIKKKKVGDLFKISENLFNVRYYIDLNITYFSDLSLLRNIQNISARITKNPIFYNTIERQRNLRSIWNSILNSISAICFDNSVIKDNDSNIFLCFFKLFLKVCLTVLDLNEKDKMDKFGDVISFILTYFPQYEMMKRAIPIDSFINELRILIGNIQMKSIKINDVVFAPAEKKELKLSSQLKEAADVTLVKFYECEVEIIEISNALKLLETIRQIIRFFLKYNSFLNSFNLHSTPETSNEKFMKASFTDSFSLFSNEIIFMLKSDNLKIDISPSFFKEWLGFMRSIILNELMDRKETFAKMTNQIPFIDYSRVIRKALLNYQKINAMVYKAINSLKISHSKESEIMLQSIKDKEKKYNEESLSLKMLMLNLIVSFKFENMNTETNLISAILNISSELYQQIQKNWIKLIQFFRFYENFYKLLKVTQELRNDFKIDKKEFPSGLCQYVNLAMCINLSLLEISKSDYISNELKMIISEFNETIRRTNSLFRMLLIENVKVLEEAIYIPIILKMQDLEKALVQTNILQFTNKVRTIFAHALPIIASVSTDQFYSRCEEMVKDILSLVDSIEDDKIENKFNILYNIKCKIKPFKQFQEPFLIDFYNQLKISVNCELNLSFIKSLIAIHNLFLLSITSDNQRITSLLSSKSSSFHKINNLPPICQIPEITQKFDYIINKYCFQKKFKTVDDNGENNDLSKILSSLASNLMNVKLNAELCIPEIISSLKFDNLSLSNAKALISNYMKLKSVYQTKLDNLNQIKQETHEIKQKQEEKLNRLKEKLISLKQEEFKLRYELKNLSEIEKQQQEYFRKPALENLKWVKEVHSSFISKFGEKRKSLNPVIPEIRNDLREGQNSYPLPVTSKVTYDKIIEIEQRFQKTYEKNKSLWEKAKVFFNSSDNFDNEVKIERKSEVKIDHEKIGETLLSNVEISKEFESNVQTVYELFKRSNFIQQLLFSSSEKNENGFVNHSNLCSISSGLSSSSSSSNLQLSSQSSGNISGGISTSFVGGSVDEEDMLGLIDAFNDELFDRSMKFYFINKILARKSMKKSRRKIKIKKSRKTALSQIIEGENQQ